jgi:uncharacterized protein with von Willebrand factor type A (vWA) domain
MIGVKLHVKYIKPEVATEVTSKIFDDHSKVAAVSGFQDSVFKGKEDNMAGKEKKSETAEGAGPVHQPLEEAWLQAQRQCQQDQLALQEHLTKLHRATTQDEYKEAHEKVQAAMAAPPSEPSLATTVGEAFAQYKSAIRAAVSDTDMEELDPATLAAIGQSLSEVAQLTYQATQMAPPAKAA